MNGVLFRHTLGILLFNEDASCDMEVQGLNSCRVWEIELYTDVVVCLIGYDNLKRSSSESAVHNLCSD